MDLVIEAKIRKELGKKTKKLRKNNFLPAVLYGHGIKNISLSLNYNSFDKVFSKAGESSLIDLKIDNKNPVKVLVHDIQKNPVTGFYIHVDFYQVKMTEKITTEVELEFIGESKAVKEQGGILVKSLDKVEIECLPKDLIQSIQVDISHLNNFNDMIRIADLKLPAGIEIKEKMDEVVALVQPPRTEEELKRLEEKPEEAKVEEVEEVKAKVEEEKIEEGEKKEEKKEKQDESKK